MLKREMWRELEKIHGVKEAEKKRMAEEKQTSKEPVPETNKLTTKQTHNRLMLFGILGTILESGRQPRLGILTKRAKKERDAKLKKD